MLPVVLEDLEAVPGPFAYLRSSPLAGLLSSVHSLRASVERLGDSPSVFQKRLRRLLERCMLTPYSLGKHADVDSTYIRRLLTGEKRNPSKEVVGALGAAMDEYSPAVGDDDVARLLRAAGHVPVGRRRRFFWPFRYPTLTWS